MFFGFLSLKFMLSHTFFQFFRFIRTGFQILNIEQDKTISGIEKQTWQLSKNGRVMFNIVGLKACLKVCLNEALIGSFELTSGLPVAISNNGSRNSFNVRLICFEFFGGRFVFRDLNGPLVRSGCTFGILKKKIKSKLQSGLEN